MTALICDTSGLLSAFSSDQPHHEKSAMALLAAEDRHVSSLVLAEIDVLVTARLGKHIARQMMTTLSGPEFQVIQFGNTALARAADIMTTYSDMDVGIVDAALVVHAAELGTREILTLDQRHFRAIRGLDGRHFRLLPFDLDD